MPPSAVRHLPAFPWITFKSASDAGLRTALQRLATALNRMGIRTGQGQTWTADRVEQSRRTGGIRAYAPAVDRQQWLTMRDAATYAGISHHFVRTLIDRGVLPSKQVVPDAPWQIRRAKSAPRMAAAAANPRPG